MLDTVLFISQIIAQPVHALSCMDGIYQSAPDFEQETIPSNGEILTWSNLVTSTKESVFLLKSTNETPVEIDVVHVQDMLFKVVPNKALEIGQEYSVVSSWGGTPTGDVWQHAQFTVEPFIDDVAPEIPVIVDHERDSGEWEWGTWDKHHFILDLQPEVAYYKIEVADNDALKNSMHVWDRAQFDQISLGYDECLSNLGSEDVKAITHFRVQAYDLAGNASDWSEVYKIKSLCSNWHLLQCGCSVVPVSNVGLFMLASIGMVGMRRRRS